MSKKRPKHAHVRENVGGSVVLHCLCGWKAWPKKSWLEPGPAEDIPPEREQWREYHEHRQTPARGVGSGA